MLLHEQGEAKQATGDKRNQKAHQKFAHGGVKGKAQLPAFSFKIGHDKRDHESQGEQTERNNDRCVQL